MKMYLLPGCPFAHRATFVLREKNVAFDPVFFSRDKRPAELEAMGPHAKSPTLIDGDDKVWDSQIVLEYVEERHPMPALMPKDARGRAIVRMLAAMVDQELGPTHRTLTTELIVKPKAQRDDQKVDEAKRAVLAMLPEWDQRFGSNQFLCGRDLTLADVTLYTALAGIELVAGIKVPTKLPNLSRWQRQMAARPSAAAVVPR